MTQNSSTDDSSRIVIINGKRQTVADVQKSFAELEFLGTPGTSKIVDVLLNSKEPLTREQLGTKTGLSIVYIISILSKLQKYDYIVGFHIGNRRTLYYALSEKGFDSLSKKGSVKEN